MHLFKKKLPYNTKTLQSNTTHKPDTNGSKNPDPMSLDPKIRNTNQEVKLSDTKTIPSDQKVKLEPIVVPPKIFTKEEAIFLIGSLLMPQFVVVERNQQIAKERERIELLERKDRRKEEETLFKKNNVSVEEMELIIKKRLQLYSNSDSANKLQSYEKAIYKFAIDNPITDVFDLYKENCILSIISSAIDPSAHIKFLNVEQLIKKERIRIIKNSSGTSISKQLFRSLLDRVRKIDSSFSVYSQEYLALKESFGDDLGTYSDFVEAIHHEEAEPEYVCYMEMESFFSLKEKCKFNNFNKMSCYPIFILGKGYFSEKFLEGILTKYNDHCSSNLQKYQNANAKGKLWNLIQRKFDQISFIRPLIESKTIPVLLKKSDFNEEALPLCISTPQMMIKRGEIGTKGDRLMTNERRLIWGSTMRVLGQSVPMRNVIISNCSKSEKERVHALLETLNNPKDASKNRSCSCSYVQKAGLCMFYETGKKQFEKGNAVEDPIKQCISHMTSKLKIVDIEDLSSFKLHSPSAITSALSLKISEKGSKQNNPKKMRVEKNNQELSEEDILMFLEQQETIEKEGEDMVIC